MKKIFATIAIMIPAALALCASAGAQNLAGTVLDENDAPMEFATIAVISLPDSTILSGGMCDINGFFNLIRPDNASLVQVSMIGYKMAELPVSDFAEAVTIRLHPDATILEGAVVRAQLPRTEVKGDAVVTNIAGSVLEHTGNTFDVLGKVPGMITMNGELQVIGRGAPVFYLNGRRINDTSELRNLMSEDIKSVEVVSNPGALYGGEINCVVRIRTVKHQGEGFSFALTSQAKQHIYDCHDFEPSWSVLDLNYRVKGWDFFGKICYWENRHYQISDVDGNTFANGIKNAQVGTIDYCNHLGGMQYEFGANWQINDKHSLGIKLKSDKNRITNGISIFDTDVFVNDVQTDHLHSVTESNAPTNGQWLGNLYYDGNAGKLNINFNADFLVGQSRSESVSDETGWTGPVAITSHSDAGTGMGAGKLVLSYPIGKGMLQAGSEETYVVAEQKYSITKAEIPASDASLSENTIAGFAQYSMTLPFGQLGAGLRYEHVDMNYNDFLNPSNNLERHQNNLFPSLNFSTAVKKLNLTLSYTGKTTRPGYNMLTNEIFYDNHFIYQSGDPKLLNEKKRTLSLNANWQFLNLSANYERDDNTIVQWAFPYNDEGVVMLKTANLNTPERKLSFYLTAAPSFGVWYPQYTLGFKKQFVNLTVEDQRVPAGMRTLSLNKPMFVAQVNNAFRFKHSWTAEANYQFISSTNQDIYLSLDPLQDLNFSVQKSFLKDEALTLRLTWSDVLNKNVTHILSDYGCCIIDQSNDGYQPCVMFRVSYRFNSARSKYKGTGAGEDAKSRM